MKRTPAIVYGLAATCAVYLVSCAVAARPPRKGAERLVIAVDSAVLPIAEGLAGSYEEAYPDAVISLIAAGRSSVMRRVAAAEVDGGLLLLAPVDRSLFHTPVARDLIVLIARSGAQTRDYPSAVLADLLTGRLAAWPASDPERGQPVTVFTLEAGESARLLVESTLLEERSFSSAAHLVPDTAAMLDQVRQTPGGLGYLPLNTLPDAPGVTILSIAGIPPAPETALDWRYPLVADVVLLSQQEPRGALRHFLDWLLSAEGQQVIGRYALPLSR